MRCRGFWVVALGLLSGCAGLSESHKAAEGVEGLTLRESHNNAHLIVSGDNLALVDAGLPADAEALEARIRDAGFDPSKIRAIIITHGHADHAGGARHFQQKFGTPIVAGRGDASLMTTGRHDKLCPTDSIAESRLEDDQSATYTPTEAEVWVEAPIDLKALAGIDGTIHPLPGHTEGSLVVVAGDVALVGDLFRGEIVTSGAEIHFYMCDLEDNQRDIKALLETLAPKATTFFVGHFGPVDREDVEDLIQ